MKRCLIARLIGLSLTALPCSIFAQEPPVVPIESATPVVAPSNIDALDSVSPDNPSAHAHMVKTHSPEVQIAGQTTPAPKVASKAIDTAFQEPDDTALKIAFLMPQRNCAFETPSLLALKGFLAGNYASEKPSRILLVYPGSNNSIAEQLDAAAMAGAMIAVGPIERGKVEEIARLNYVPLPVIALNQVDLDDAIALTPDEIAAEKERIRLEQLSEQIQTQAQNAEDDAVSLEDVASNNISSQVVSKSADDSISKRLKKQKNQGTPGTNVSIAAKTTVPGLVYADDVAVSKFRYEAKIFPRNFLMLGLSMEDDASYIARLGVAALPETTESGEKPKVLLLDHDTPLEKRISEAFERELVDAGYAPDRMTVDINDFRRVNQFFKLVVDKLDKDEFDEVPIDQEVDPVGWRQQQIRIRRLQAAKRARAALSEPPYYAAFLAMDAQTASQIRSRLPLRTRIWGTPLINPGDTKNNPQAKAMTYDLMHVALTEAPLLVDFDIAAFEEKYRVPAPQNILGIRLFALGSDAFSLALSIINGSDSGIINGNLGSLHYNLSVSPLVERRGQTAMIYGGSVRSVTQEEALNFQSINTKARPLSRLRAQSRSLERLEREAEAAAQAAGTLAPRQNVDSNSDTFASMPHNSSPAPHASVEPKTNSVSVTP